jgi:hypothetical protein
MQRTTLLLSLALVIGISPSLVAAAEGPSPPAPLSGITGPGGFLLSPTRIVLGGSLRSAQLTLVNNGSEPATYRLTMIRMRMLEDGRLEEIAEPDSGESFADTLVRFSPRQVDLEPNVAQTVRFQLRAPVDLPAGEYRSHLLIRAVPRSLPRSEPETASPEAVSIQLTPIYGAAIPIIVRQGATDATVAVEAPRLLAATAEQPSRIACCLARSGTRSVYGDLIVTLAPRAGKKRQIGRVNGVAVYVPNRTRRLEVPIDVPADRLGQGRIEVRFEEAGPAHGPLASATIPLD